MFKQTYNSTNHGSKILKKKNSRKFQKAKIEFVILSNYLHGVYIVLGILSNLEMIQNLQEVIWEYYTVLYKEFE